MNHDLAHSTAPGNDQAGASRPGRTRSQAAGEKMRFHALWACREAENAHYERRTFHFDALAADRRRAAHALLHAALAHCLASPGRMPKTLRWQGRLWYLTAIAQGRLRVSAYRDEPGLVSMPGSLF